MNIDLLMFCSSGKSQQQSDNCFYRGGFYEWFEGGPMSGFLDPASPGLKPSDGLFISD
jgi:hypothetical protein